MLGRMMTTDHGWETPLTDQPQRKEFTTGQASAWFKAHGFDKMSQATVIRKIDEGEIAARRTKGGQRRIRLHVLENYVRNHS